MKYKNYLKGHCVSCGHNWVQKDHIEEYRCPICGSDETTWCSYEYVNTKCKYYEGKNTDGTHKCPLSRSFKECECTGGNMEGFLKPEIEDPNKTSEDFSVNSWAFFTEQDLKYNGGYHHASHNLSCQIKKGGKTIVLNEAEIKAVVANVGATFRR